MDPFKTQVHNTKFGIVAAGVAVTATIGAYLIEILPHTFLLEKYKNLVQIYR